MQNDISRAEMEVIAGVLSAGGLGINLLIEHLGESELSPEKGFDDFLLRDAI
jgi:hypothetical protein